LISFREFEFWLHADGLEELECALLDAPCHISCPGWPAAEHIVGYSFKA